MSKVRWVTLLGVISLSLAWITGCGSNPPIAVTVRLSTASVQAGGTQQFTATVANDSANKGVNWSVSCSAAQCGSVSPTSTASGVPTTYTAPATPPSSTLTVTITATSQADPSKSSSATITVPAVTVSVAPSTATVTAGSTQAFTATVMNTSNTAVTWTLTQGSPATPCPPATCGTLSSATANPVTYTAPTTSPSSTLTVTITATSQADSTKSGTATITVTTSAPTCPSGNEKVMLGQYAFLFQGYDANGPVAIAGTFDADGTGKVATVVGVEDINNSAGVQQSFPISSAGSSYSVGSDNRGCLTIATMLSLAPVTYRFAVGSLNASSVATSGRMIESDVTGTLGSGVIRLQDPTAFLTSAVNGNYVFGASSTLSLTTPNRFAVAGAFTTNGAGGITAGELDINSSGIINGGGASPLSIMSSGSSYSVTANGRGTLTLHFGAVTAPVNASFYIVSASELLIMSIDSQTTGGSPYTGTVLGQPAGTGFSNSSLSGNDVFALAGLCGACGPSGTVAPHLSVGVVNISTPGSFTLNDDVNKAGALSTESHAGTYTVDSSGRVALTITPTSAVGGIIYLVSANQGFMVMFDNSVQTGTVEPQTAASFNNASLNGTFFFGTTNQVDQLVTDTSGVETFDGVGTVTGTSDSASIGSSPSTPNLNLGQAFNESYSVTNGTGTPGRGTISSAVSSGGTTTLIFYIVSPSKIVLMDATANTYPGITIGEK
jgi:hypothetical protein